MPFTWWTAGVPCFAVGHRPKDTDWLLLPLGSQGGGSWATGQVSGALLLASRGALSRSPGVGGQVCVAPGGCTHMQGATSLKET